MGYLKALLKITLILMAVLAASISIYTYFYGEEIKSFLIKEVNKQLLVQTDVKEIEFSLWKNFPDISLIFKDVKMSSDEQLFCSADDLRVKFSLLDLLDKNFALHSISISSGEINLVKYKNGKYIPDIWLSDKKDEEQDRSFTLDLKKISLNQILMNYVESNDGSKFNFMINSAWARGNFSKNITEIGCNAELNNFSYQKDGKPLLEHEDLKLEAICLIKSEISLLEFKQIELMWKNMELRGNGSLDYSGSMLIDLSFEKDRTKIGEFSQFFSEALNNRLDSLNSDGFSVVSGNLKGQISPHFKPSLKLDFHITQGSISIPERSIGFNAIELRGDYFSSDLSIPSNGRIDISSFKGEMNGIPLEGKANWSLKAKSSFKANAKLKGELKQLNEIFKDDIDFLRGDFETDLDLDLNIDLMSDDFVKAWKKGENSVYLKIDDAEARIDSILLNNLSTELALGSNDLYAKSLDFELGSNHINFKGEFLNLISFAIDSSSVLWVDGELNSPKIDLTELLATPFSKNSTGGRDYLKQYYLRCKVDQMNYQDLELNDLHFYLLYNDDYLEFKDFELKGLEGDAQGDLAIKFERKQTTIQTETEFNSINVHELFKANKNFDQEMIKAENLYGKATGFMNLQFKLDEKNELISESLVLNGFIDVVDGRLVNYEPLFELSKYIELDELKEIKFKRLQNQIRIANEEVYIPRFQINSSALDVEMEGTHKFNNQVDYRFTLLLNQILGKKAKKPKDSEFGFIEDDGLGKTQLFLRMKGDINDPDISYDNQQLGKHLKNEVKEEKREIKAILKEEFGLFKKDTTLRSPVEKKNDKPLFEIEWDEDLSKPEQNKAESEPEKEKKSEKKGKFGKFIDKIAKPNEDEYVSPQD